MLGIPEHKVRVVGPDVGGGFGSKCFHYTEEVLVVWASERLKRPVKWTADRNESFLTDAHGRDHTTKAEMGFDNDGRIVALRVKTLANLVARLIYSIERRNEILKPEIGRILAHFERSKIN